MSDQTRDTVTRVEGYVAETQFEGTHGIWLFRDRSTGTPATLLIAPPGSTEAPVMYTASDMAALTEERDKYLKALQDIYHMSPFGSEVEKVCIHILKIKPR